MNLHYDIIVVGGGHAGCEAAAAAANLGAKVLLITMDMTKFATLSCNPAMGGIAKGQILREIDAMGGYSGIVTDRSSIQFRMLNRSKGPAMWSPRAQCDRQLFSSTWREILESIPNISFWQDSVCELIIDKDKVTGVKTELGLPFYSQAVILTAGTFLDGVIHVGLNQLQAGRAGERSSHGIGAQLQALGFERGRMKTGTSARLDGRTIDFSVLTEQKGDENPEKFSFLPEIESVKKQRSCYITYTSPEVHEILEQGFEQSPMFTGRIKGIGPRYCPSIEDKIRTFSDKDSHQLFIEPEGYDTHECYLNGFSSSLPFEVQFAGLRKIKGLEKVQIFRPGYAIEYDYFPPTQLNATLETKLLNNLYFAGQINGTTGYEEAAAQGLMAGINAYLKLNNQSGLILGRDEAYIGVLIDDLVTKGVDEPYRMFTSRAEYRILLRQDNADSRLTPIGYKLGLVQEGRNNALLQKQEMIGKAVDFLSATSIQPDEINNYLIAIGSTPISQARKATDILSRPQVNIFSFAENWNKLKNLLASITSESAQSAETSLKYKGYIEKERLQAVKNSRLNNIQIPQGFDFSKLASITIEARQKLSKLQPRTVGQAARIPGVSPADISVLLVFLGR